jgi:hypothetical protein
MTIKHTMAAGPSSFSVVFEDAELDFFDYIPGPHEESDFEWDNGDTTWGEATFDTLWDEIKYSYKIPPGHFHLHGQDSIGRREVVTDTKHYWLEAGGVCDRWLEDDMKTYTEWWDEVTTTTPWDKGKTPWDTKNDLDTVWDEKGTGIFEKTYWFDFIPIGIFLFEGQNAGIGYTLHATTGEFN